MTITKLKEQILEVLKTDDRVWAVGADDKKELNQTSLLSLVEKIDENIIQLLLEDDNIRDKFFVKIKDVYVFKTNDFVFFMEENKGNNMYTQYKNQIGLTDGKRFLDDSKDVVLNWPFKDCILEGGQSAEEGMDDYFQWQETTMKDKLDDEGNKIKDGRKNEKEVDVEGHYEKKQAKRKEIFFNEVIAFDEIDRLEEPKALVNWKRYTAKVVEEVTELKRDEDGTIKENLIIKGNNLLALHSLKKEFTGKVKLIYIDPPFNTGNDSFQYNDKFNRSTWLTFMKNRLTSAFELLADDGNIFIHIDINQVFYLKLLCDEIFGSHNFVEEIIWSYGSPSGGRAAGAKPVNIHDYLLHYSKNYSNRKQNKTFIPYSEKYIKDWFKYKDEDGRKYQKRQRGKDEDGKSIWTKQYLDESKGVPLSSVWSDIKQVYADPRAYKESQAHHSELVKDFSGGQKPEKLIERILNMCSDTGDIVLDYHLGTGTTAVTAHKLNRQYIGIEQMDYINDYCINRLNSTISGDTKGISKSINWKGGGEFVYCELAKWNETAKEQINESESLEKLIELFDTLYEKYFLNYNLKIKEFREKVILEDNFKYLSLEEQKSMFLTMLDLNQMYVNESEMEDKKYDLSEDDIALTKKFYNKED